MGTQKKLGRMTPVKPEDPKAKKVAWDKKNLEAWLTARRKRLNQYS